MFAELHRTYKENNHANKCAGPWTTGPKRTLGEFAPLQINHNCIIVRKMGQPDRQTDTIRLHYADRN